MDNETLFTLVVIWTICGVAGAIVGSPKNAAGAGFLLGFLLGPIGIIVAFAVDGRRKCPKCATRVNAGATICPQCSSKLVADADIAVLPHASTEDYYTEMSFADRIQRRKNLPPRSK